MYANSALLFLLEEVRKEIATARVLLCEKFKKVNAEKMREKTGNEVAEKTPLSNWVMLRLGLHLRAMPYLTTAGFLKSAMNNLMEAQVDGYLCRRIPDDFSNAPLAICEAMPCVKTDRYDAILRQETVEMACWIAERHGNKRDGFLQSCAGGAKRRLMISQDRHEIYMIIGEYGSKYGEYITGNAAWLAKAPLPLPLDKFDLEENRKAARGSASYNEQAKVMGVEDVRLSHMVRGDEKKPASGSRALRSQHPRVLLSADEFLIMHQFGPVITSRADNMERPVRRLVGLCYSLTQTQNSLFALLVCLLLLFFFSFFFPHSVGLVLALRFYLRRCFHVASLPLSGFAPFLLFYVLIFCLSLPYLFICFALLSSLLIFSCRNFVLFRCSHFLVDGLLRSLHTSCVNHTPFTRKVHLINRIRLCLK